MAKRWNGWGDEYKCYPLPSTAVLYLEKNIGIGAKIPDASLEDILSTIPPSNLIPHPKIILDPEVRLRHARGQSLPDWIALRSGKIDTFPDGVAYPTSSEEIRDLLNYANQIGAYVIPYGGGTSVVGHINPPHGENPILTIDLSRMYRLIKINEKDSLATIEAGARGPVLEKYLRLRGYTLGHFPQSFEYSTLGGWVATRSSGQQSYYYGKIEDLFAGGRVETPIATLALLPFPASAAGPDLREVILGSEGRYGILTEIIVRVRQVPEVEGFYAVVFPHWELGISAIRTMAQEEIPVSMLRLSDSTETELMFVLSGKGGLFHWLKRGARFVGWGKDSCLLLIGITGTSRKVERAYLLSSEISQEYKGIPLGSAIGEQWRKTRFATPYLRNTLWENGYAVDTLETAINWSYVTECSSAIKKNMKKKVENILVFSHISHVYRDGASIYVTYIFPRQESPEKMISHWKEIKDVASRTILEYRGTISHQHGIGRDHLPYIVDEKSEIGMKTLAAIGKVLDPNGILNPGALFG